MKKQVKTSAVKAVVSLSLIFGSVLAGLGGAQQASAASTSVVIAEVFNAANPDAEWITLANVGTTAVNLTGWKLQDYSAAGNVQAAWTFPAATIAPNSLLVVEKRAGISGASASGVQTIVGGEFEISGTSDRVELLNNTGALVDGVAWGTPNTVEGFSVALPATGFDSGQSLERTSRTDSDAAANWTFVTTSPVAGVWAPQKLVNSPVVLGQSPNEAGYTGSAAPEVKAKFTYGNGQSPAASAPATLTLKQGATTIGTSTTAVSLGGGEYEIKYAVPAGSPLTPGLTYTATVTLKNAAAASNTTTLSWNFTVQKFDHVVISEIYGDAIDETNSEFIELYNPTNAAIDISGYKFGSTSATGVESQQGTVPAGTTIAAKGYYLIGDASVLADGSGAWNTPNLVASLSIANSNGAYWVKNGANAVVDKVAWNTNAYGEAPAFPVNPSQGVSLERLANDGTSPLPGQAGAAKGNGWDTGRNNADFLIRLQPQPQNAAASNNEG